MDSNSNEKKPKRPRIGQPFRTPDEGAEARPSYKPNYDRNSDSQPADENGEFRQRRPYQPRPYNGYNAGGQRQPRPYNNGGYQQRPYQQRPQNNFNNAPEGAAGDAAAAENRTEGAPAQNNPAGNNGGYQQRPYQQRQYNNYNGGGNRQQRPYNNQGGYNNRNQGGYNKNGNNRRYNNQGGGNSDFPGRGKSFTPRPKRIEYEVPVPDPNEQIRLNKYMSNAGLCSRREADEFIQQGLVKVNGQVVTELGTKITHSDVVEYDDKVVTTQSKCYILLNKPKDCVTTSDDPNGRLTVMDLVKDACPERIYPVGRLDRNTTGVLLLTNDGDLASKLTHPKYVKKKIYHVWCDRDIAEEDMQRIADGIELEDGPIHADAISYATETDRNQAGIEIHSGRNRIVRRIFESLGYHVVKLDRVYFAGLTKKNLPRGRWRYLTQEEVNYLKMGSFE